MLGGVSVSRVLFPFTREMRVVPLAFHCHFSFQMVFQL